MDSYNRGAGGRASFLNTQRHSTAATGGRKRLPPYARSLVELRELIVVTGAAGWAMAASATWFPNEKVLLPYGDNPERYAWQVRGVPCTIFNFGSPEPHNHLVRLSINLIEHGSTRVIWAFGPTPATMFLPGRAAA